MLKKKKDFCPVRIVASIKLPRGFILPLGAGQSGYEMDFVVTLLL